MLRDLVVKVLSSIFIFFIEFEVSFEYAELSFSTFQRNFFSSWLELHPFLIFSMNWQSFNCMRVFMHSKLKDSPASFRTTHIPSILEVEDFIVIDDCVSAWLEFEVCTVKAFVNVLDGADGCADLDIDVSSVPFEKSFVVRHNILISVSKTKDLFPSFVLGVPILNDGSKWLVILGEVPFTLSIDHAWRIRLFSSARSMHHELLTQTLDILPISLRCLLRTDD